MRAADRLPLFALLAGAALPALLAAPAQAQAVKEQWSTDTGAWIWRAVVDNADNTCVLSPGNYVDFQASKVDPSGNLLWTANYGSPNFVDQGLWIATDSQGDVIVTGYRSGSDAGFLTVKWDGAGNLLWADHVKDWAPAGYRVEVDALDNVYVAGAYFDMITGGYDFTILKYDPAGRLQWRRNLDLGSGSDLPKALAVSPGGMVAVAGESWGSMVAAAWDTQGTLLFAQAHPALGGGEDVKIGANGDVYVCGTGAWTQYAGTVVCYAPDGTRKWVVEYNGPNGPWDRFVRMAIDPSGNVVAVGRSMGNGGFMDWSVIEVDRQGNLRWSQHFDGFKKMDEWALAVDTGPDGRVYVAGKAGPSPCGVGVEGRFVCYLPDGTQEWVYLGNCQGIPTSIQLGPSGELMVDSGAADKVYRLLLADWVTLGQALPGSSGTPDLTVTGFLEAGGPLILDVANGPPSALGWFVVGTGRIDLPFAGGVMVPLPDLLLPFRTDAAGADQLAGSLPPNLPAPISLYLQAWLLDAGAPRGLAATDAVMKRTY